MEELKQIAVEFLRRGRYQPRHDFNPTALQELANSIQEQGIVEPIIVRPITTNSYEIIAGERRWRAAQLAGLTQVPAIVRDYTDEQAAEVTLIENIQRENLNPIEEAEAFSRLLQEFDYTHEEIAVAVGKSRTKITNCLRLLYLDKRVQQLLIKKSLSEGHGKALASLAPLVQVQLALRCVEQDWSVRRVEQEVKKLKEIPKEESELYDPNLTRLERIASERFNSEVKVENNSLHKSGWIRVKYYDYDTLSGILKKMGVKYEE